MTVRSRSYPPLIGDPCDVDQLFLILYRELYYRHVYSRLQPDIDDRFHSYENSCELFNYLLSAFLSLREPLCPTHS
jgi:translation initiation factor 3 subunit L